MLKEKRVLVAGGCGLIGRAITQSFQRAGSKVTTLDIRGKPDVYSDIETLNKTFFDNFDVFVNATYPKHPEAHFVSAINASERCAESMAKRGGGSVVNLASIYGVVGSKPDIYEGTNVEPTPVWYSAAKGAIISMTRALACKYGRFGVRVNCVSPGGVYNRQDELFVERYCERAPLGRMATPEDVAGAVVYLAEADYVTGVNLLVDGGLTIQ